MGVAAGEAQAPAVGGVLAADPQAVARAGPEAAGAVAGARGGERVGDGGGVALGEDGLEQAPLGVGGAVAGLASACCSRGV